MIVLFSHVRTGRWASVMPEKLADTLGLTERLRSIPIIEPEAVHQIGLVVPPREPMTPLVSALLRGDPSGDQDELNTITGMLAAQISHRGSDHRQIWR